MDDIIYLLQKSTNYDELNTLVRHVNDFSSEMPKWYNSEIFPDWYETHLDLLYKGDKKSVILAKLMPKNERQFMWYLYKEMSSIDILKIIAPNVKLDKTNGDGETFLFQIPGRSGL